MEFTKDDLRAAYSQGFDDGVFAEIKEALFNEEEFNRWFEFVFKDRLDEEQAYTYTQSMLTDRIHENTEYWKTAHIPPSKREDPHGSPYR